MSGPPWPSSFLDVNGPTKIWVSSLWKAYTPKFSTRPRVVMGIWTTVPFDAAKSAAFLKVSTLKVSLDPGQVTACLGTLTRTAHQFWFGSDRLSMIWVGWLYPWHVTVTISTPFGSLSTSRLWSIRTSFSDMIVTPSLGGAPIWYPSAPQACVGGRDVLALHCCVDPCWLLA